MMKTFVILFAMLATFQARAASSPAPFQVSIQWKDWYGVKTDTFMFHICNGIIIHEKYVLTTANCLYTPMGGGLSRLVRESDLTVIGGFEINDDNNNGTTTTTFIERNVVSIILHNRFNKTSLDNDIAVLKLDRVLPLVNNTETQWLNIATGGVGLSANDSLSCFSTVFNASSQKFYSIVKSPSHLQHWVCDDDANEMTRKTDLCFEYLNADEKNCNSTSQFLHYSPERGSAYICNNKLIAILADINLPKNPEKCIATRRTTAYYVNVTMHLDWLLSEETGITNLGIKNGNSDSAWTTESSDSSHTTIPPKKNGSNKIDGVLLILIFLAAASLTF